MEFLLDITEGSSRLLVARTNLPSPELIGLLKNAESYRDELDNIGTEKRKREFLVPRILLNQILNSNSQISYSEEGSPVVSNSEISISISHSHDLFAIAVDKCRKVGIDIETVHSRYSRVAARFLSNEDITNWQLAEFPERLAWAWNAKESVYKIFGKNLADFRNWILLMPWNTENEYQSCRNLHIKDNQNTDNQSNANDIIIKCIKNDIFTLTLGIY